jgi:protease-4
MTRRIAVALGVSIASLALLLTRPAPAQEAAGASKDAKDKKNAPAKPVIPVFVFDGPLTESPADEELPLFGPQPSSLKSMLERMGKAAGDPNVKAVVVLSERGGVGLGQIEEVRKSIANLRAAGKEVYSHADSVNMVEYVMLSNVTRLSATPTSDLWLGGIHAEQPYLRGLLDKLGVEPDYMTNGAYKSAAELFMRTGPSKEADEMMNWLLDGIYGSWVNAIAEGRKISAEQAKQKIDGGLYTAERAKEAGLFDAVEHRQDFEAMLRQKFGADVTFDRKYGKPAGEKMDFSSPMAAFKIWGEILSGGKKKRPTGPSVGVVYVEGMIVPGANEPSLFGATLAASSDIRRALDKAAEDDTVKAVVLRIDSPGGSATASEIILDATKRVKAKKPFVVSMGNVAGSGGYYVACGADTIFADENTITGSIGVVGGKMVTTPMWGKIGITFKEYDRGKNAGLLAGSHKFTDDQRTQLKTYMTEVYDVFKGHVTTARGTRLKKPVEELAGGRVYTGKQALELGLVDQIGSFDDAVKFVAKQANLGDKYDVRVIPEPKNFLEMLAAGMSGQTSEDEGKHVSAGGRAGIRVPAGGTGSITELAMPYLQQLDPARVRTVRSALQRLDLMREEGVILAMPEVNVGQ